MLPQAVPPSRPEKHFVSRQTKLAAGSFSGDPVSKYLDLRLLDYEANSDRAEFPARFVGAEPKVAPRLLLEKILTVDEVKTLFDIFFTYLQPQTPFLDRFVTSSERLRPCRS